MRTKLAPDLFDRRFDDLLAIGRAYIPSIAPEWTDHNLHDPGITLMELLAWTAEAQIYSLSRMRRDERAAYAKLLGLQPRGPQPATGLIWPDRSDPIAAAAAIRRSMVIAADDAIHTVKSESPTYRCTHNLLWVAGHIAALKSIGADGVILDHTSTNARGDVSFKPFGDRAGPHDILRLEFECFESAGLFPSRKTEAQGAHVFVGVRVDAPGTPLVDTEESAAGRMNRTIAVTLEADGARHALPVTDSTQGFMQTGVIALDVSGVPGAPRTFALEFRSPEGFSRPPRVLRIDMNVIPIGQGCTIERELFTATGLPDQILELATAGLRFGENAPAVKLETVEAGDITQWELRDQLGNSSPSDRVFALDAAAGRITLGNGVNGRAPAPYSQMFVTYAVCEGKAGNAARNQKWLVKSVGPVLGTNLDPVTGGKDAADDLEQRRQARRRSHVDHALVTSADIESAARALPALEVARAIVVAVPKSMPNVGGVTLIAMRARPGGIETVDPPETARWIAEILRRLTPRLPLGTTLIVRPPRYIPFSVIARLEAAQGYDPVSIKTGVTKALAERLALVATRPGHAPRSFGAGVSVRDLAAWIRKVPGVRRIVDLRVVLASGQREETAIKVPKDGLPKIDLAGDTITVVRSGAAGVMT